MQLPELIDRCCRGNHQAQAQFYQMFAPVVLGVCRRYLVDTAEAEDAMIQAMFKSMTSLESMRDSNTIHGWIRRIAVNECLMMLGKKKLAFSDDLPTRMPSTEPDPQARLQAEEVLGLLDKLPMGYRTIFNLYVLEGYTHKEIGELLDISLNTSKSQLIRLGNAWPNGFNRMKTRFIMQTPDSPNTHSTPSRGDDHAFCK
ncbi:MAG: sigma-70 family RNA polymerase sigma factor [Saprospiraceae bacterium]|nr:sigma-70 family RNA polymerase sigma factor [Saprospiraceae bacterium]